MILTSIHYVRLFGVVAFMLNIYGVYAWSGRLVYHSTLFSDLLNDMSYFLIHGLAYVRPLIIYEH